MPLQPTIRPVPRQPLLPFPDGPTPNQAIWEQLDPLTRQAALSVLARILTGAIAAPIPKEEPRD